MCGNLKVDHLSSFQTYDIVKSERWNVRMSESKADLQRALPIRTKKVRVWSKGQFTIPADIRERMGIKEDTMLEVFQVGRAIVITPEKMLVKELAFSVRDEMEKYDMNLNELLNGLRSGNHKYETD
jgi:AbrB family looped-hinge helix DNA binding protein